MKRQLFFVMESDLAISCIRSMPDIRLNPGCRRIGTLEGPARRSNPPLGRTLIGSDLKQFCARHHGGTCGCPFRCRDKGCRVIEIKGSRSYSTPVCRGRFDSLDNPEKGVVGCRAVRSENDVVNRGPDCRCRNEVENFRLRRTSCLPRFCVSSCHCSVSLHRRDRGSSLPCIELFTTISRIFQSCFKNLSHSAR